MRRPKIEDNCHVCKAIAFQDCLAKTRTNTEGTVTAGRSVWEHCLIVGNIAQELAKLYGNVNSSRFIGNCMRKNRLLFILPCHRVVKKNRAGNYLLGEDFKNWLLNLEKSHISDFINKDV